LNFNKHLGKRFWKDGGQNGNDKNKKHRAKENVFI
jgi:hypothetical protein